MEIRRRPGRAGNAMMVIWVLTLRQQEKKGRKKEGLCTLYF